MRTLAWGPILEAVVKGQYYWIPFANIQQILVEEPADLRDFVWMPAQFTWANGGQMVGVIPTRYAASESSEDEWIQLARKTEWIQTGENAYAGLGQRMFATDGEDYSLLDIREINLGPFQPAEQGGAAGASLDADGTGE